MSKELKIAEIAERIADVVITENYLNKVDLCKKIEPILKAWTNFKNIPHYYNEPKSDKQQLVFTIRKERLEHLYTRDKLRTFLTDSEMKQFFIDLNEHVKQNIQ